MILAVHIFALLFGYFNGRHDVPAVDHFTDNGSSEKEQSVFHGSNFMMKLVFCLAVAMPPFFIEPVSFELLVDQACVVIAAGLDVWIVFDPVVAWLRKNKQAFFYLSDSNKIDHALINLFGQTAGAVKTIAAVAVSVAITMFLL